jgi:small subunit ribosomal protein S20
VADPAAGIVAACVFGRQCAPPASAVGAPALTQHLTQPTRTTIEACPVANIKSQIKRNRQNDAAHERNKSVKSALKSAVRKFREAADAGDADQAKALAAAASRKLDKAASAGVIHKNQAANKKSSINKRAASL